MEQPKTQFSKTIMVKKGVLFLAKLGSGWLLAHGFKVSVSFCGFELDTASEASIAAALGAVVTMGCNALKINWPERFDWL